MNIGFRNDDHFALKGGVIMKMHAPEKGRARLAAGKAKAQVDRVHTRSPRKWFQAIMVMSIMAGTAGAHIREAYGQGEALYYAMAITSGESVELTASNCEKLREALKKKPLAVLFEFIGRADEICESYPSIPSGPSTQSVDTKYPYYVVANEAGTRLYTANSDSTVSTIDVAAAAPIGTIQFPNYLDGGDKDYELGNIAINPMGTRLYVLNTIYRTTTPAYTLLGNEVEVIDTEMNAVVATVPLGLENQPNDVVVDATGSRVYVTTTDIKIHDTGQVEFLDSGKVNVIDDGSNTIVKTIPFSGQAPGPLVANPDGSRVYVGVPRHTFLDATQGFVSVPARVSVIDTSQDRITQTIDLEGSVPRRLAVNPTGTRLYSAYASDENFLEVIDTASNHVITRIDIPVDFPSIGDIQVGLDGAYLFMTVDVSTGDPDLIYIFDTSTNTIVSTIELPPGSVPGRMAPFITVDAGHAPLSNFSSASLILQTPVIQVPGFGEYNGSFVLTDPANLELTLTDVSGTSFQTGSPALFSLDTGVLTLPVLGIDGKAFFDLDLTLVPDSSSLQFQVTRVAPLP
jgi:DNA-binding beta-propeller fold protein YncE